MAVNHLILSTLNPIKFQREGFENPAPYQTKYIEDFGYPDTIRDFEEPKAFFQPFLTSDIIYLQILSNYAPHNLKLYNCQGTLIDSFVFTYVANSTEGVGFKAYQVAVALDDYDFDTYFFKLFAGSPILDTLISERFTIYESLPNSVLLQYQHDENDYDVVFETGIQFGMRLPGGLTQFQPGSDRTVYIDQPRNIVQLSGKSFYTQKLIIGDAFGVPDWMVQRVNEIFLCSEVLIDGKQYVAVDGAVLTPNREELYPMAGWSLDVRQAEARSSKRFEADGDQDNELVAVYNIDTSSFGNKTLPAGSNIIQVENSSI